MSFPIPEELHRRGRAVAKETAMNVSSFLRDCMELFSLDPMAAVKDVKELIQSRKEEVSPSKKDGA
jgi:hypothetical protein